MKKTKKQYCNKKTKRKGEQQGGDKECTYQTLHQSVVGGASYPHHVLNICNFLPSYPVVRFVSSDTVVH